MFAWLSRLQALVGVAFNWLVRGGGIESAFFNYKNVPALRYLNAAAYGLNAYLLTCGSWPGFFWEGVKAWFLSGSVPVAVSACGAMAIGQAPGWGRYIGAMRGQDVGHDREWGLRRMTLRGLFWGACLAVTALFLPSTYPTLAKVAFAALCVNSGAVQGVIYFLTIEAWQKYKWPHNRFVNDWTTAEMIHGAFLWLPLLIVYKG